MGGKPSSRLIPPSNLALLGFSHFRLTLPQMNLDSEEAMGRDGPLAQFHPEQIVMSWGELWVFFQAHCLKQAKMWLCKKQARCGSG